MLGMTWKRWSL